MNKIAGRLLSIALGFALAGGVFAQAQQQPGSGSQAQQPGSGASGGSQAQQPGGSAGQSGGSSGSASRGATKDAPVAGKVPLGVTVEETDLILKGWRASKLVGAAVYNDEGRRIGKIEDMIVSGDGKVSAAIVDVGGFLGIGKHRVAIPVDQFSDINAKKLVLPKATKEVLKALPEFQYAKGDEPRKRG
jgi:sporulation protein YlmC with PRC-barrel domain